MARTTEVWKSAVLALALLFAVTSSDAREPGAGAGASAGVTSSEVASPHHSKRSTNVKKKASHRKASTKSTKKKSGARQPRHRHHKAAR